jgi:hypothetical protein
MKVLQGRRIAGLAATRLALPVVACLAVFFVVVMIKLIAVAHLAMRLADVGGNVSATGAATAGAAGAGAAGAASSGQGGGKGAGDGQSGGEAGGGGTSSGDGGWDHGAGGVWHTVIGALFSTLSYLGTESQEVVEPLTTGMEATAAGAQGKYVIQQSGGLTGGMTTTGQFESQHPGCDVNYPEWCR